MTADGTTADSAATALTAPGVRAGLVMDFDGVLSPITDDPAGSRLVDGAQEVLAALVGRLGMVALLSGRPAAFLADRVQVAGVHLLGAYGLEEWRDGAVHVPPAVDRWRPVVQGARVELEEAFASVPGILVEDKGLAVAVHWRRAADAAGAQHEVERVVHDLCARTGLQPEPGKMVLELRPPLGADKGSALRRILETADLDVVAYAGDDRGDLPAFAVVREVGGHALVVHGPEIAPEVAAVPGATFDGPPAFLAWLRALAAG